MFNQRDYNPSRIYYLKFVCDMVVKLSPNSNKDRRGEGAWKKEGAQPSNQTILSCSRYATPFS